MYKPKFKIGDIVGIEKFNIKNAAIIGIKAWDTSDSFLNLFKDLQEYLTSINDVDYFIAYYDDEIGRLTSEFFPEKYLIKKEDI